MRRLWLLMAFILLVLIDLSVLPTIIIWVFLGSVLTTHGAPFLASILFAAAFGAALLWLTVLVWKAWRRAPRPS